MGKKINIEEIEELIRSSDHNVLYLLNKNQKLEDTNAETAQKLEYLKYKLLADETGIAKLHSEIKVLKRQNEKIKRKHERKYDKMRLELLSHIVRLQSQMIKEDDSKILDIVKFL